MTTEIVENVARELSPSMVDALTSGPTDGAKEMRTLNALIRRGLLQRRFTDGDWVGCELTADGQQVRAYLLETP